MRKIETLALSVAMLCALPSMAKDKDPVLMEVGKAPITLSEFEYLYHKNSQQQLEEETLDEYLERFIVYKLKVEDAKAAGIDTTSTFKNEFASYRRELAAPYLQDSTVTERLARETYQRMKYEVDIAHIMLPLVPNYELDKTVAKLDSIKQCVLNGEEFGDLAVKYSIDRSAPRNRGHLGFMTVGRTPYSFESAAYTTPVGEMTIVKSPVGVHLIKVLSKRPAQGEVLAQHILKLFPRNATDSIKAVKHAVIDSIYRLAKGGADFDELAKRESEDPGSAAQGGMLRWFGTGIMVPEFEKVAFALSKDSISEPFETQYGIHIIKKLNSRSVGSYESCQEGIMKMMQRDERANMPREERIKQLRTEYGLKENPNFLNMIEAEVKAYGKYDSTLVEKLQGINCEAFTFDREKVSAGTALSQLDPKLNISNDAIIGYVDEVLNTAEDAAIVEYETDKLKEKYPDFRNLLNEYYDGMMLFEISNRNVWDKANRDVEGLEAFFNKNKANYTWEEPRFKGYLIYTANDSLKNEIMNAIKVTGRDTLFQSLRKKFKRDIRIEHLLVKKGENANVDALRFGVEPKAMTATKLPVYFEFEGKIIEQPEEASDVRGQVTADYQNVLENQWVAQLKKKYKVKVNKKVLKQVK